MISSSKMIEVFGKENLVYSSLPRLSHINLPSEIRHFVLNVGLPVIVSYFRFSMDFESIAEDIQLGESARHLRQIFTIGCKGATPLIGRIVYLSEIGLDNNASLSDIGKKLKLLGEEDDMIFGPEVTLSYRICIDLENEGQIISIKPKDLSITFLNSSIQQLAASLISYEKNFSLNRNFEKGLTNFERELRKIDLKALDSENNLWVKVMQQLIEDEEGY